MPYTITIPLSVTSQVVIDWGDGQSTTHPASGPFSHTYQTSGSFDVTVFLNSPTHMTNFTTNSWVDRDKVVDVKQWGESNFTGGSNFINSTNLKLVSAKDYPRRLVNASRFFQGCSKLETLDYFKTPNVTNMFAMFLNCAKFNGSVINIITNNVTTMESMFEGTAIFNQSVSHFNTSNVTNMAFMFYNAKEFNQPVPFDGSKVTTFNSMFFGASAFNQVVNFITQIAVNTAQMFANATVFNSAVFPADTRNVTAMNGMFSACPAFNQSLSHFDMRKVTTVQAMFGYSTSFNQDLSSWQIPLITNMVNLFSGATGYNTTNTDALLNSFASQTTLNNVNCSGAFRPRTSASDTAKATLVSRGWTGIV